MTAAVKSLKVSERKTRGYWARVRHSLLRNGSAIVGGCTLLTLVMIAVFAPVISPHDPLKTNFGASMKPVNTDGYLLGTDDLGRDTLSRLLHGSRISLMVGFIVVGISGTIGVLLGAISGFYGGIIDDIVMRLVDILYAFPFLILAIAVVGVLGPSLLNVMIVLGAISWIEYARLVRGLVLSIKAQDYVEASRALGAGDGRIILRHILPNSLNIIIVQATFGVASAILSASALSFLGMGAQPPTPEWGAMLSEGQKFIRHMPVLAIAPGFAILITVLSINLIGDALRDALDPRTVDS